MQGSGVYSEKGRPTWSGLSMEEKNQYVEQYSPLIKYLADRLAARLPDHINKDDLISSGVLGLIDAVDKFDPGRAIMFKTYAEFRIKGAMLDELRSLDWVPRSVRKKANQLERLWQRLEGELGRPATDEEAAAALEISTPEYLKLIDEVRTISILDLDAFRAVDKTGARESRDIYDILADENALDALTILGQGEVRDVLAKAVEGLAEKERLVVTLYYHEELTMKEIGLILGYTESRISQLHTKSLLRLRAKLRRYFEERGAAQDAGAGRPPGPRA
ncbi:MAG: FliA/WhiG family RNA polymerase sigma factor [Candidatus Adiutrix sp.]|jgi:RNA polymerase sigma factor for flagellar operon FliA|nr:FliA/WhiG family RNA polymerase sigma factor [Candidatus Adiutrix sp.]